ncbi:putative heme binding protein [Trypoxylus dichotomus]
MFLTVFTIIIGALFFYIKWSQTYWKRRKIPYLKSHFLFGNFDNPITSNKKGNFAALYREFYERLKEKGLKCGGVYAYIAPVLVIADPEYNKHVLLKNFSDFHIRGLYSNKKDQPISVNMATSEGEDWRKLRTNLSPTFTTAKMKIMFDLTVEIAKQMGASFGEHAMKKIPVNVGFCAYCYVTDTIGTCSFGLDVNSFRDSAFCSSIRKLVRDSFGFIKMSFCMAFPEFANFLGIPLYNEKQIEYFCNLVDDTMKNRRESKNKRNDLLQIILDLQNENVINDIESKGFCMLFLLAGFEPTGSALTFALFELAVNEDVQNKLRDEIHYVLNHYNDKVTYEAVYNMKYLDMIICEVLRKYPPVAILNRTCARDTKLPNTDFTIEKGTKIIIPICGFHYDPEFFPNPDKFDPERFSEDKQIKPYTYIPFGEGPRSCIGDRFSRQSLKVGILTIIRNYRLKLNPKVKLPLELVSAFTISPATDILLDVEEI